MSTLQSPQGRRVYQFSAFKVDCDERRLLHLGQPVALTGKAFEMLTLFVQREGRTVSKAELMDALWPEVNVQENNIAVTVRAIRKALQAHDPKTQFIETVQGRGYRLLAPARRVSDFHQSSRGQACPLAPLQTFVGRERELKTLSTRWRAAKKGTPRLVFIHGEPGVGKSWLVQQLLSGTQTTSEAVLVGRCLPLAAGAEPYLPWLDALNRALSDTPGSDWFNALSTHAPGWCDHFPRFFPAQAASAQSKNADPNWQHPAASPFSLVEALLSVAATRPVLIVLEDFHWADAASIDLLRLLEAQLTSQSLLVVATYRPEETGEQHPLRRLLLDLEVQRELLDLNLSGLREEELGQYLECRFPDRPEMTELANSLWQWTEGLPLFASHVVDCWQDATERPLASGGPTHLPTLPLPLQCAASRSIEAVMRQQFARLTDLDRHTLDAASVEGEEFRLETLAYLLAHAPLDVEQRLQRLVGDCRLLTVSLPSSPQSRPLYRFCHVLFQAFLYRQLGTERRRNLHSRAAAARLRRPVNEDYSVPVRVAQHLELAGEFSQATLHYIAAGTRADRIQAPLDALTCFQRASQLLRSLPVEEQLARKILIHHGQGWSKFCLQRFGEAELDFQRMYELAAQMSSAPQSPQLRGLDTALAYFRRPWHEAVMKRDSKIFPVEECQEFAFELRAESLGCRCQVFQATEQVDALARSAQSLLQLSETHASTPRRAEALAWLALHAVWTGNFDTAQALTEQAARLARSCRHNRALLLAQRCRAKRHALCAEFNLARELLEKLLPEVEHANTAVLVLCELAEILSKQGETQLAMKHFEESQALVRQLRGGFAPFTGELLRNTGQLNAARKQDERTLVQLPEDCLPSVRIRLLASLALTLSRQGEISLADQRLRQAQVLSEREVTMSSLHLEPLRAARCSQLLRRGKFEDLSRLATHWAEEAREQCNPEGVVAAMTWLASVCAAQEQWGAARGHLDNALNVMSRHPLPLVDWRVAARMHRLARQQGDSEAAHRALLRARQGVLLLSAQMDDHPRLCLLRMSEEELRPQPRTANRVVPEAI